jgi:hypothetical protein
MLHVICSAFGSPSTHRSRPSTLLVILATKKCASTTLQGPNRGSNFQTLNLSVPKHIVHVTGVWFNRQCKISKWLGNRDEFHPWSILLYYYILCLIIRPDNILFNKERKWTYIVLLLSYSMMIHYEVHLRNEFNEKGLLFMTLVTDFFK